MSRPDLPPKNIHFHREIPAPEARCETLHLHAPATVLLSSRYPVPDDRISKTKAGIFRPAKTTGIPHPQPSAQMEM